MNPIESALKFAATHTWRIVIAFVALLIIIGILLITEDGKALLKFFFEHPIFLIPTGLVPIVFIGLYLVMLRPHTPDEDRVDPNMVWDYLVGNPGSVSEIVEKEMPFPAVHPSHGIIFRPVTYKFDSGFTKPVSVFVSDKKNTVGRYIRIFDGILTEEQIDKYFKKSLSFEDKLIAGKQAEAQLERLAKKADEQEEYFGKPEAAVVG